MSGEIGISYLENPIRDYAWGSPTAIPRLLDRPNPQQKPQAELWMGAHPAAPSRIVLPDKEAPLTELIDRSPQPILGKRIADRFANKLPFLFKVLAAAEPLSIQAHPNFEQAREGFERENRAGIPLTAANRSYKDPNHKPEIICALTDFWAMKGFRPLREIAGFFCAMKTDLLKAEVAGLANPKGLAGFYSKLMRLAASERDQIISAGLALARDHRQEGPALDWVCRLCERYPSDVGALSLLNLIRLKPGEALYLPAGVLHAYLEGTGMELMANSDNVLRGGLTPKHIDVDELLSILRFETDEKSALEAHSISETEDEYPTPASEFRLSVIRVQNHKPHLEKDNNGVQILFCSEGEGRIYDLGSREEKAIYRGASLLIPACVSAYEIQGQTVIYKASVP